MAFVCVSSIEQYHAQLQEGTITCVQAVAYYLQKIKDSERLNAFIEVYAAEALEKAKQLDANRQAGKTSGQLHGVVIGLKDLICYKDHRISASSNILKGFTSLYSATAVERLLAEDAIIIGNLNCDEFGMGSTNENSAYGPVHNALDETRVSGGSSGGSAVAVQAGLCMISLGTDTGGSVRQPAGFCGIVGLKPGYGRISRYGLIAYASSFDQLGIFANTIPDIARVLEIVAGPDEYDSTVSQQSPQKYSAQLNDHAEYAEKKYRFAFFQEALDHPALDPEIALAIKNRIGLLQKDGHEVVPVQFDLLDYVVPAYYILTTAEASSNLSRYDGIKFGYSTATQGLALNDFYKQTRSEGFGQEVKRRILLGTFVLSAGYYDAYFTRAQKVRRLLRDKIQTLFGKSTAGEMTTGFDFILLPVSPGTAPKLGEKNEDPVTMYLSDIYTVLANLTGIPAISLPLFKHSNGMPFGLQVMANRFDELNLLQACQQLMQRYKPLQAKNDNR